MFKVFNLHFTDKCNYVCKHCFIKKENYELEIEQINVIINNIKRYLIKNNIEDGRINLAGGEPLITKNIQEIVSLIFSYNIKISLVTNGSLLTTKFIENNVGKISMIGISIDSLEDRSNKLIGRCNKAGTVIPYNELVSLCNYIKSMKIKLKINICVSKYNILEDFTYFLNEIQPDRLKLLQMTIDEGINDDSISQIVTEQEFNKFSEKYNEFNPIKEISRKIKKAYLIIDSRGNIGTSNAHNNLPYNLLRDELNDIIDKIEINRNYYDDRY
jgi:radical S-adenosyl methionine domain-containing protein 2